MAKERDGSGRNRRQNGRKRGMGVAEWQIAEREGLEW